MKFTTSRGYEVDVPPIALADKEKFMAMRAVNAAFADHEKASEDEESGSDDEVWDTQWVLQEKIADLCRVVGVNPEYLSLGDCLPLISILQTGSLPSDFMEGGDETQK